MTVSSNFSLWQSSLHNRPYLETLMQDFEKNKLLHNPNKTVDSFRSTHYNRDMGGRF